MDKFKEIRPIALGLATKNNKLLVGEGFDNVKNQTFYRCLGGGIEFLEKSSDALRREFSEEINANIIVKDFLGISENIFTYKGKNAQNYVVFNGDIYRIIKVDKFRHTYLIRETNDVINKNDIENYINYYNNDNFSENAVNKMWGKTEILTNALYKQTILNGSSFINVDNNVWLKDEDTYKAITINNEFTNEEKAKDRKSVGRERV